MPRAQVNARAAQLRQELVIRSLPEIVTEQLDTKAGDVGVQAADQKMTA